MIQCVNSWAWQAMTSSSTGVIPLKNMSSSVGMTIPNFPIYGKVKMFQTTNQIRLARKMRFEGHVLFKPLSRCFWRCERQRAPIFLDSRWSCQSPQHQPTPVEILSLQTTQTHLCCRHGISEGSRHRQTTIHWSQLLTHSHIASCAKSKVGLEKFHLLLWTATNAPVNYTFITVKQSDALDFLDEFGCSTTTMRRFPKLGIPLNHPFQKVELDFPCKPSRSWGTPPFFRKPPFGGFLKWGYPKMLALFHFENPIFKKLQKLGMPPFLFLLTTWLVVDSMSAPRLEASGQIAQAGGPDSMPVAVRRTAFSTWQASP